MDIGKSFSFVFEDEEWVSKVLIGAVFALLSVFIIGSFFLMGYFVEIVRNVANGSQRPLPQWDNLGGKLGSGFVFFLVWLVYAAPMIVLYGCMFIALFAMGGTEGDSTSGIAVAISWAGMCLVILYAILLTIIAPAVTIRFAVTGSFGACFQFGQLLSFITANAGSYIIAILLSIVASFIGQLGIIACGIGVLATSMYAMMVTAHLYGQVYRESVARGGGLQTV